MVNLLIFLTISLEMWCRWLSSKQPTWNLLREFPSNCAFQFLIRPWALWSCRPKMWGPFLRMWRCWWLENKPMISIQKVSSFWMFSNAEEPHQLPTEPPKLNLKMPNKRYWTSLVFPTRLTPFGSKEGTSTCCWVLTVRWLWFVGCHYRKQTRRAWAIISIQQESSSTTQCSDKSTLSFNPSRQTKRNQRRRCWISNTIFTFQTTSKTSRKLDFARGIFLEVWWSIVRSMNKSTSKSSSSQSTYLVLYLEKRNHEEVHH